MKKHDRPAEYRIIFQAGNWVTKSERYFTVYHSSEALDDIYYSFMHGGIHSDKITILKIEEYITYQDEWVDRMEKALEHATELDDIKITDGKIVIRKHK